MRSDTLEEPAASIITADEYIALEKSAIEQMRQGFGLKASYWEHLLDLKAKHHISEDY
jgi:hypothetical protein